jgi:hypothetical protein
LPGAARLGKGEDRAPGRRWGGASGDVTESLGLFGWGREMLQW